MDIIKNAERDDGCRIRRLPLDRLHFGITHIRTIDRLDWMDLVKGPLAS